ncbi:UNVERIFIED_CONTAM: hypothetical protein GTU68_045580 [Idotea baltica]|nr:hypothetical protein [Idotea baltica]
MSDEAEANDETVIPEAEAAYGAPVSYSRGQRVIHPALADWCSTAQALLEDGWNVCIDLTAVDYLGIVPERFEVVGNFLSHSRHERLRARVQVPESAPSIGSLFALYPGSDLLEREVFDMFGIEFVGHPDLSRILMPEGWVGHPLRKDYAVGNIPVQFKGAPGAR